MATITYKSVIPNYNPQWLQELDAAVDTISFIELKGTAQDFRNLDMYLRGEIGMMISRGLIRNDSKIKTETRTDSGKTVLMLFCNRMLIQTYFIE